MANRIEVCEAQMLGFGHAIGNNEDLIGLISNMGLKKKEWEKIKAKFSLFYFTELDIKEIDNYFNGKTAGNK